MRFQFRTLPQSIAGRFKELSALLLLGGGLRANRVAVRPDPEGGGAGFAGFEVRGMMELAGLGSVGAVFGRTFFGHGGVQWQMVDGVGVGHLGGPRGLGISRRKVSGPWQWGQVKGSGGGSSREIAGTWPRRRRRRCLFFLAAPAARP